MLSVSFYPESNEPFRDYILNLLVWLTGWTYFVLWISSSYPQLWTNFKLKSVSGLSFNYLAFNILGHLCYSLHNICLFAVPTFRKAYFENHPNSTHVPVFANDVAYSVHAFIISASIALQCLIYPHGDQSLHLFTKTLIFLVAAVGISLAILVFFTKTDPLALAYFLSTTKVAISFFKSAPQIYHNYKRKSTEGWSIVAIDIDVSGGILSVLQMLLSAWKTDDWHSLAGNSGKLALGLSAIGIDLVYMVQHYCLYSKPKSNTKQLEAEVEKVHEQKNSFELVP